MHTDVLKPSKVIAFDAHVLKWNLDDNPPDEFARHHVKEASFYGTDTYELDLVIRLSEENPDGRLLINFMGLEENGMWPAKKRKGTGGEDLKEEPGSAMAFFEELDAWLDRTTGGTVDALLMGCVGGVVEI